MLLAIQARGELQGETLAHANRFAVDEGLVSSATVDSQHHAVRAEVADAAIAKRFPVAAQCADQIEGVTPVRAAFRPPTWSNRDATKSHVPL